MKNLIIYFLLCTSTLFAQTKDELLILMNDHGKINLVPMYGGDSINKTDELIVLDRKFVEDQIKQFGNKDSACKMHNMTAWKCFYEGDIKMAMRRFNQAWLLDTNNASEYFGFSAVLEVIKDNPDNYFETQALKIKNVDDPKKYYQIGIQKDKDNINEIFSLKFSSTGFETYNKLDLAMNASNRLNELTPKDTFALLQRGHLHILKKDWEKAITDFELAIQNGGKNANLFNDLGYSYQEKGDYENAFKFYEKSFKTSPTFLNPIYNDCLLRLKLGQYESALEYIDKCIAIKNDVGEFHKTKGEILIKLNKKEEGIICLRQAKKLGDKDAAQIIKANK